MSHTPGPWHVEHVQFNRGYSNEYLAWTAQGSKGCIAEIKYTGNYREDRSEDESNARLIAAAPELLEALRALFNAKHSPLRNDNYSELWDKARAVIAKAEGK